ncbi:pca operon transcription factor PcaQ [Burkholderia cenocepacia]|uniref:pca operon transcription factor PcaQ n=1 Tax=Burkholderia cenocepacia TaxID=95486 RepID=UPI002865C0C8|nr:pca operon transcription factor PcaQ [Burkholderia cenocepacia]MDR5645483.1 pca operon transcription factor PcaQ [Burkholderia cenocepacia]
MEDTLSKRIKFRHMQCFLAVFQLGTAQRAADSLALTQPAVSKTIAELEEIVGAKLFERGRHGAVATRHGQLFAPHARACVEALRLGVDELKRHDALAPAMITIGVLPTLAAPLVAPALGAYRHRWRNTSVRVVTGNNRRLLAGLQSKEFAFAIGRLSDSEEMAGLSFEHLLREPLSIAVRPDHPLLDEQTVTPARLAGYTIIVPPPGTLIRRFADNILTAFGTHPSAAMIETLSVSLGRELAMRHDAIWFVPSGAIEKDLSGGMLVLLRMPMSGADEPIGLLRNIGLEPDAGAEALIKAVREVAQRRNALQVVAPA